MQRCRRFEAVSLAGFVVMGSMIGCGKDVAPTSESVVKEAASGAAVTTKESEPRAAVDKASPAPATDDQAKPTSAIASSAAVGTTSTATTKAPAAVETSTAAVVAAPNASAAVGLPLALEAPAPTVVVTAAVPDAPLPPPVESPKQSAQAFSVWLQSSGRYSAGQQGTVEAVVVPKGEFHCNQEYPYKFVASSGSAGVTYPKPTVRAEGLSVSSTRAAMRIPFVPQNAGDAKVGGTFHFSVCTDSQCVVEKRDVFVTVKVQ